MDEHTRRVDAQWHAAHESSEPSEPSEPSKPSSQDG